MQRAHPAYSAVFVFLVAPIGAAVVIAVLLLFGVPPRIVFAAGLALKSFLRSHGIAAPNAVGVLLTVGIAWVIIAAAGLAWARSRRRLT